MRDKLMVETLLEAIHASQARSGDTILAEALGNVQAMLAQDDKGWELYAGSNGADSDEGLSLDDLKAWSKKLREDTVGAPWIKRGLSLRSSYIWQGGIQYDGIPEESRGRGTNVKKAIDNPINQRAFFGKQARRRREGVLYHDGLALWIGDDKTKVLEVVPLDEINDTLSDPDHSDIIWAYRRTWNQRQANGKYESQTRWYFVDTYKDKEVDKVTFLPKGASEVVQEIVDKSKTAFDMHANSMEGWKFGSPDALAAWVWNKIARDLYMDGVDVSEAMASIVFKASAATANGTKKAAIEFASPQGAGGTAILGGGNELNTVNSAGRGYDFSHIREVVALIAAAIDVSSIHLTTNPGDAGSSYGSAQSLDLPTRLAMSARRDEHIDLDTRVLKWMAGKNSDDITVYFMPLDDAADVYRHLQAVTIPWLQGVITDDTYKELAAQALGVPDLGKTPQGMLYPNNKKSLQRSDIDTDGEPTSATSGTSSSGDAGGSATTPAPTQGRATGVGGGASRDTRDDTVSK